MVGVPDHPNAHTVKGELVEPFANAAGHLKPQLPRRGELTGGRERA